MEIKPLKSLRSRMQDAQADSQQAERLLKTARKLMEQAAEQDLAPWLLTKAIDLYAQVIELTPARSEPYLALAYLYWKSGEHQHAAHFLKTLLACNPTSLKAQELYAQIEQDARRQGVLRPKA